MDTRLLLHIFLALLLFLIPAGALYLLERKKIVKFCMVLVRMVVQLLLLSLMVWALIKFNKPWLSVVWLAVMSVLASWLVVKRCELKSRALMPAVATSLFVGVFLVSLWLLGVVMPVRAFDARWFVPVTALLLGHSVSMLIRGLSTYLSALKTDELQYEFHSGNGLTHLKSLRPFVRRALLAVLQPTMSNLSVLALTSMPLLLCGLLLGGLTPINAFVLMLFMVTGCVSSSIFVLGGAILLADWSLFDKFGKLNDRIIN
jgi:putative ABC transport system permease protein